MTDNFKIVNNQVTDEIQAFIYQILKKRQLPDNLREERVKDIVGEFVRLIGSVDWLIEAAMICEGSEHFNQMLLAALRSIKGVAKNG